LSLLRRDIYTTPPKAQQQRSDGAPFRLSVTRAYCDIWSEQWRRQDLLRGGTI